MSFGFVFVYFCDHLSILFVSTFVCFCLCVFIFVIVFVFALCFRAEYKSLVKTLLFLFVHISAAPPSTTFNLCLSCLAGDVFSLLFVFCICQSCYMILYLSKLYFLLSANYNLHFSTFSFCLSFCAGNIEYIQFCCCCCFIGPRFHHWATPFSSCKPSQRDQISPVVKIDL